MTEAKVDRTTAERIAMMIREGMPIEEIADIENIPPRLVAVLEHSIALREGEGTKLERLMDLLKENTLLSQSNIELKDYAAKQLGKWLVQAGMQPGQIHICTGLSIHKCRHLYQQVRAVFDTEEAFIPMPQTFISRLVMSIFASHYLYLQSQSDTRSIQLPNVVVAWSRTVDEVINSRLDELAGFDRKLISLGSLFDTARCLREVGMRPGEKMSCTDGKRVRKIARSRCEQCGSYYVWCVTARRHKASRCCFCELLSESTADKGKKLMKRKLPGETEAMQ